MSLLLKECQRIGILWTPISETEPSIGLETYQKYQLFKKYELKVANFAYTNLQICLWKNSDAHNDAQNKVVLISECYVFLQQFFKSVSEQHREGRCLIKHCDLETNLVLYGRQTGKIQVRFDLIYQPFFQQKVVGIATEEGIKMSSPLIHRGQKHMRHAKISELSEHILALNDLLFKRDYADDEKDQREYEKQLKDRIKKIHDILIISDKKGTHSFTYGNVEDMIRAQQTFLDIGMTLLDASDKLERNLDQAFYSCFTALLKRGEFFLPNLVFDKATGKQYLQKAHNAARLQRLLYSVLLRAFDDLSNSSMSLYRKKFVETFLAIAYFRIPEFRFALLAALGNKPYNEAQERSLTKYMFFTGWNINLFGLIPPEEELLAENRALLAAALEKSWLERLKSRVIFFFYYSMNISYL